jgi:hypothetical protein
MEKIFKAKRLDNGEWVEFGLFNVALDLGKHFKQFKNNTVDIFVDDSPVCIDKNTICQYTGINSEGNRIFEGDEFTDCSLYTIVRMHQGCWVADYGDDIYCLHEVAEDLELTGHNIHDKD